jgi:glucoamylase
MPLLWAHAEFLKLLVARERGRPLEMLRAVESRYAGASVMPRAAAAHWRNEVPVIELAPGRDLLIEDREPFTLHFGFDGWQRIADRAAVPLPLGLWGVRLTAAELADASEVDFRRCYPRGWEDVDHHVALTHPACTPSLRMQFD